jgi:hypothetical protein
MKLFGPTKPDPFKMGMKRDVKGLIKALSYDEISVRCSAAGQLGDLRSVEAIDSLVLLLKNDPNEVVRESVTKALGDIGGDRALKAITGALRDNDWAVRASAAEILGKMGNTSSVDELVNVLNDPIGYELDAIVDALGKIGGDQVLRELLKQTTGTAVTFVEKRNRESINAAIRLIRAKQPKLAIPKEYEKQLKDAYSPLCFKCGGQLERIEKLGFAMEVGIVKCLSCSESFHFCIVENKLILRRVSVPIGFVGVVERVYELGLIDTQKIGESDAPKYTEEELIKIFRARAQKALADSTKINSKQKARQELDSMEETKDSTSKKSDRKISLDGRYTSDDEWERMKKSHNKGVEEE